MKLLNSPKGINLNNVHRLMSINRHKKISINIFSYNFKYIYIYMYIKCIYFEQIKDQSYSLYFCPCSGKNSFEKKLLYSILLFFVSFITLNLIWSWIPHHFSMSNSLFWRQMWPSFFQLNFEDSYSSFKENLFTLGQGKIYKYRTSVVVVW